MINKTIPFLCFLAAVTNAFGCDSPAAELKPILEKDFIEIESEFNRLIDKAVGATNSRLAHEEAAMLKRTAVDIKKLSPSLVLGGNDE
ncbi:hypothetical protein A165_25245 [Vibrio tasmaniensis ZS-17]|uniref:hypothetical protein n=1 Tax=Vibrio tasmaniensis TaxID=212663 RepID=UPI0002F48FBF|nr:hypothetical protein [Vibrio tasmaniensis]OED60258.1 hypothetical protein A165_25245 [Vibrio tasmaniensis ZS-17]